MNPIHSSKALILSARFNSLSWTIAFASESCSLGLSSEEMGKEMILVDGGLSWDRVLLKKAGIILLSESVDLGYSSLPALERKVVSGFNGLLGDDDSSCFSSGMVILRTEQ